MGIDFPPVEYDPASELSAASDGPQNTRRFFLPRIEGEILEISTDSDEESSLTLESFYIG